jgi:hypothetical protein
MSSYDWGFGGDSSLTVIEELRGDTGGEVVPRGGGGTASAAGGEQGWRGRSCWGCGGEGGGGARSPAATAREEDGRGVDHTW